ncbi:monooxygenase [Actinorhabdospora filicis]|uniref:Monooxygenase n=1 Tax=Actinorhabdospora filicis TaxID=1785913 RepID=A0A9W6SI83_9ACTN|nr:NAD(P)/FAD-dependent oxidoreductase [Actinorhabdospora filicis]GLZ75969.1 monooxygenase [Actinorhabdospora filicis]
MRILIAGAGIAGAAAARALLADGHDVTVLERSPEPRVIGGAITLWPGGLLILDELGADLTGLGQRITAVETRTAAGRVVATADVTHMEARFGAGALVIPRGDLLTTLLDGVAPVHYGARVATVEETGKEVRVTTEDGAAHTADLLIGADGVGSAVRAALWGPAPRPETGVASWQGLIPSPVDLGSTALMIVGRDGYLGLSPAGNGLTQWFMDAPWPAPPGDPLALLEARYGHWAAPVPELFTALRDADVRPYAHHRHHIARIWGAGRSVLIGDAAHAMPPSLALGTNQALEDIWVLRRALRDDPRTALGLYSLRRRASAKRASRLARWSMSVSGPLTLMQSETQMRMAARGPKNAMTKMVAALHRGISERLKAGEPAEVRV